MTCNFNVHIFCLLVAFISNYFITFDAVINRIASFISLSESLLLVYRNADWEPGAMGTAHGQGSQIVMG